MYLSMNMEPSPKAATASEEARAKLSFSSLIDLGEKQKGDDTMVQNRHIRRDTQEHHDPLSQKLGNK